jgi:steroid 5-alpha reductase family enzyme
MQLLLLIASHALVFSAILLFIDLSWVFLVALYLKSNGIVDVAYGLAYILVAATTLWNFGLHPLGGVATLLVCIWGLRLAIRIHERTRGKPEDFRYAAWRREWKWFKTRSYFQIYMLQGFIIFLVSIPVVLAASHPATFITPISIIGIVVWIVGFLFESIGDYQLDTFIRNPEHKGMLMQSGLWSITRHPNYFGEATMWWGLWLVTLPALIPLGTLAVVGTLIASPILITFLLLKVSGVPMLEAALSKRAGWQSYAARVSVFVPWFPRRG